MLPRSRSRSPNARNSGRTGVGNGVALPHARLKAYIAIQPLRSAASRYRLEAIDDQPVDVVFLLLLPAAPGRHNSTRSPALPVHCEIPGC